MAILNDNVTILTYALYFLKKYRAGFENAKVKIEYDPTHDSLSIFAISNIGTANTIIPLPIGISIYSENEIEKLFKVKWVDPIC